MSGTSATSATAAATTAASQAQDLVSKIQNGNFFDLIVTQITSAPNFKPEEFAKTLEGIQNSIDFISQLVPGMGAILDKIASPLIAEFEKVAGNARANPAAPEVPKVEQVDAGEAGVLDYSDAVAVEIQDDLKVEGPSGTVLVFKDKFTLYEAENGGGNFALTELDYDGDVKELLKEMDDVKIQTVAQQDVGSDIDDSPLEGFYVSGKVDGEDVSFYVGPDAIDLAAGVDKAVLTAGLEDGPAGSDPNAAPSVTYSNTSAPTIGSAL